jgi:hypothetical protein
MPADNVQKLIRHKNRRSGILVPLLEDLFQSPVEPEDEADLNFIASVLKRQLERAQDRKNAPLFSPSQLASCLRYVYLLKHHKELEIPRLASVRVEPNYYFFNGNWLHLKWQFALYKLDKQINDPEIFRLHGVEIPIVSKHGDHGGTVDSLCSIYGESVIVDFKGLNVRAFGEITRGFIPDAYVTQLADYGMLYNSQRNGKRISKGLLITENKGGPDPKHLVALQESVVEISTHLPEVRSRLAELRKHGKEKSIPPPECISTTSFQFVSCPFRKFCREEVKKIERRRKRAEGENPPRFSVASPSKRRNTRSRRNSK